jgi:spore coat protein A
MPTRRRFMKFGLAAGTTALMPWDGTFDAAHAQSTGRLPHRHAPGRAPRILDPASLTQFMDPLPLLPVLAPHGVADGVPFYDVAMTQFRQQLHAQLPPTLLWGYGGRYPGPTIEARVGQAVRVRWTNAIAAGRFLIPGAFDPNLEGTDMGEPQVKTVVHLHGADVATASDGHPEAWFGPGFAVKGPDWQTDVYDYPNRQPPAMLWYHDHAMGQTRLNVYAGLVGAYLLRDDGAHAGAAKTGLPNGRHEIVLLIQDRMFDTEGALLFPVRDPAVVPTGPDHPGPWLPEFFGNTVAVNGKLWPYLRVEPRRYRLRILNASNARFYNLRLDSGQGFIQIGADHGYLPRPLRRDSILLAPAERADVIVDFAGRRGNIVLTNDARQPFPDGDEREAASVGRIMQFRVDLPLVRRDTSTLLAPGLASAVPATSAEALARSASNARYMALVEFEDAADAPIVALLNNRYWEGGAPTRVRRGAVEVWHFVNTTEDTHPIHLHQVRFQVLGRQAVDAARYRRDWIGGHAPGAGPDPIPALPYLSGPVLAPEPDETGFKDTVRVPPGQVTSIVVRFGEHLGVYPWHCHILDHEDNAMMQRFEVVA